MGFLDELTTRLGGQQGQDHGVAQLQKMINEHGGLQGLTSRLTSSGMGQQVQSWIGTGENQPVSGSQVQQAMDPDTLHNLSQHAGMTPQETSEHVAHALLERAQACCSD